MPAAVTLAQFGLESSFGKHMPKGSNNPFGMHAAAGQDYVVGSDWDASGKRVPTKFRKFQSLEEAFEAHAASVLTPRLRSRISAAGMAGCIAGVIASSALMDGRDADTEGRSGELVSAVTLVYRPPPRQLAHAALPTESGIR